MGSFPKRIFAIQVDPTDDIISYFSGSVFEPEVQKGQEQNDAGDWAVVHRNRDGRLFHLVL